MKIRKILKNMKNRKTVPILLLVAGCTAPGEGRDDCAAYASTANPREHGAVVVRWRVLDDRTGRLFGRSQCCCAPMVIDGVSCLTSSECPLSPAWQVPEVALLVTPAGPGALAAGKTTELRIPAPCAEAELTTDFCMTEGTYDLELVATAYALRTAAVDTPRFDIPAIVRTPPAVRRQIRHGQIVNLDAAVIVVNVPPTTAAKSSGLAHPGQED